MSCVNYWTYCRECKHEDWGKYREYECSKCKSKNVGHIREYDEED